MTSKAIMMWQRLDQAGMEYCELIHAEAGHRLEGVVVGVEGHQRYRIEYVVRCDAGWSVRKAAVAATIEGEAKTLQVRLSAEGVWQLSSHLAPYLSGCDDLDLAFTPATNTLALQRLHLSVGSSGTSRAAYVRFPELDVSVLEQTYHRLSEDTYQYETADGSFCNTLTVNEQRFVIAYPPFWKQVGQA